MAIGVLEFAILASIGIFFFGAIITVIVLVTKR